MLPEFATVDHHKSMLESLDCSEEFSLNRRLRLGKLLAESDASELCSRQTCTTPVLKKSVSKVEAATTDQHFARNVV